MLMEKFENTVARLLEAEGYWVRQGFKVNVTPDEKKQIGKQASPRPEIDLLAFHPGRQQLLALEVKAYADTPGVKLAQLQEAHELPTGRYKLFTSERYRLIVLHRLKQDLIDLGMISAETQLVLGMVPGKVNQGQSEALRQHMQARGWFFWSPDEVKARLAQARQEG